MSNEANPKVDVNGKVLDGAQSDMSIQVTDKISEDITELCEDMEMVSPGSMLCEARKALSFSQEHIASTLNFKISLVKDIEADEFDPAMPVTFNRGYLTNYAKLVGVDVEDVLASYDALDAATIQRSEMLSFSKGTTKQAEQSRIMWVTYLVVAVLIGLTILWWQQESQQQAEDYSKGISETTVKTVVTTNLEANIQPQAVTTEPTQVNQTDTQENPLVVNDSDAKPAGSSEQVNEVESLPILTLSEVLEQAPAKISTAVFTFKGDCWVNISDATGERIAWGVKKAGYVMTINGVAPLKITVGKPELTSIVFNDKPVDMSSYNVGNIAKFTLPVDEYSASE